MYISVHDIMEQENESRITGAGIEPGSPGEDDIKWLLSNTFSLVFSLGISIRVSTTVLQISLGTSTSMSYGILKIVFKCPSKYSV